MIRLFYFIVRRKGVESSAYMRFAWHTPFTGSGANDNHGCHFFALSFVNRNPVELRGKIRS
jgi:hypothetical protein